MGVQILYLPEKYFPYIGKPYFNPQLIGRLRQLVWRPVEKELKRESKMFTAKECENDIRNKISRELYQ